MTDGGPWFAAVLLVIAALYAAVGQAGATGYLAAMGVAVVLLNRPSQGPPGAVPPAAGSYADLTPEQRRLIDDWVARLAEAIFDCQRLFARHGVPDTAILGHAKDGNLHFVLAEDVRTF